jgi:hypothetical protein
VRIEWRTFADLTAACVANVDRVRQLSPDVIVGVPRSGMAPASILAMSLGLPLADLHTFCAGQSWQVGRGAHGECGARTALLVEDASGFGRSMTGAVKMAAEARPDVRLMTCAVYAEPDDMGKFDLGMEPCTRPRLFSWNWWRSGKLLRCCVDIDGVVCRDPTPEQKESDATLRAFCCDAPLLYRPTKGVGAFVTGRNPAWRKETVEWMRRHDIGYDHLEMWAGEGGAKAHARHKASYYITSPTWLFIESNDNQARMIAEHARKDVLCITTGRMYRGT